MHKTMGRILSLLVILGFIISIQADLMPKSKSPYKVVCYLGSWANYRYGDGKFLIEDIDPRLCTHLIYGFAKLGHDNKIAAYDTYLDLKENWGLGAYNRFNELKKKNSELKTLLAIGGWNEGSTKYSMMARNPSSRKIFVESCVNFLTKYGFDGLDLDWEYPAARGGTPEDKKNFVLLLMELREAFKPNNMLLTAAVSAGQKTIDGAYDIPALGKYLDFINLMAYDFHGGWDKLTGHNAPLYLLPNDSEDNKKLNVDFAVKYWLEKGAPAEKLILGLPFYGRSFTLRDPEQNDLNAPITGKGIAGEFTREQGFLGYNEICKKLEFEKGWNIKVEKHIAAPYAVKERQWIGYDDIKSIKTKVNYLIKMNLGGAMIWSIETDDFRGRCHGHKYPLLQTINSVLSGSSEPIPKEVTDNDNSIFPKTSTELPTSKAKPTVPSPSTTVSTTPRVVTGSTRSNKIPVFPNKDVLSCSQSGYFRHPENCKFFYLCQPKRPGFVNDYLIYLFTCGAGTVFSEKDRICNFPVNVPECKEKNY
ncbi:chitinase-3-like protein 1 [Parasteatoda tepidariorum]|uniref:chitinase-3-like protein 1 n=1 Tax=Parasteatoda tepidariorum TaxID=114398 RepID=UPI00077FD71B|nr:chitinase-3-like protein 1 [Parasteatoda tepidariorum]